MSKKEDRWLQVGWKICNFDWLNLTLEIPVIKNPKSRVKFYRFDTVSIRFTMIPINLSPRLWTNLSSLFIIATHQWMMKFQRTDERFFFPGLLISQRMQIKRPFVKIIIRYLWGSIYRDVEIYIVVVRKFCRVKFFPGKISF